MKILITGGAGFIASHLADRLVEAGNSVVIVDNLSTGNPKNINQKAKFYETDIVDKASLENIFSVERPDIVFHFAAQINVRKSVEDPADDAKVNILGGLNVFEFCKKFNVKKIIFSSTGGAMYGEAEIIPTPETYLANPISPYGIAKLTTEKYLNFYRQVFGIEFVALRFANVYGPRQNSKGEAGVVSIFCDKIFSKEQPVIIGNGFQTRDFVFVEDVVQACIMAMNGNQTGIFNVSSGKETDINTIFNLINSQTGNNFKEVHGPEIKGEQKRSCLDYSKIKAVFGWEPKCSLDDGIKKTINWFKPQK